MHYRETYTDADYINGPTVRAVIISETVKLTDKHG